MKSRSRFYRATASIHGRSMESAYMPTIVYTGVGTGGGGGKGSCAPPLFRYVTQICRDFLSKLPSLLNHHYLI